MPAQKNLKILFVTSEVVPFVKTGGLADVSSALPQKLMEYGHQVRLVVPKYGAIDERKYKIHEVVRLKDLTTKIGKNEVTYSLRSSFLIGAKSRVQIYFLDNDDYFANRHSLYSDPLSGKDFPDNDERFVLLAKSVFELIKKLGWIPDVIHCNDWQTALIPAYLKTVYKDEPLFAKIKTLFTVHNIEKQGIFSKKNFAKLGLPDVLNSEKGVIQNDKINFLKTGLTFADTISTVSPTFSKEICKNDNFGLGIKKILNKRKNDLFGIINGIDDSIWNPEKDKIISKKYTARNLKDKIFNKIALADKFGFEVKDGVPVIGMISRLYDEKGFDLLKGAFADFMKLNIHFVLLGTGDRKYQKFFENAQLKYSEKFSCYLGFDDSLAHLIEAGSDMFLMPSKFEPCGLNQMYSLTYGTVPIVRETGGLADTVIKYDEKSKKGNGFVFKKYEKTELISEIKRAIKIYSNGAGSWEKIQKQGMKLNFSWTSSAKNYISLYKKVIK